jgi:hypothetical protein
MKPGWQEIATNVLAEHIGMLAHVVIDDARAQTCSAPESPGFMHEFILRVARELPEGVDRARIASLLRDALR